MDFRVEFYKSESGASPVRQFLDELMASDRMILLRCWPVGQNCEMVNIIGSPYLSRLVTACSSYAMWES